LTVFSGLPYSGSAADLELHVGDGNHGEAGVSGCENGDRFYREERLYLNDLIWAEPQNVDGCPPEGPPSDSQLFSGTVQSGPSVRSVGHVHTDDCDWNIGLWDILGPKPVSAASFAARPGFLALSGTRPEGLESLCEYDDYSIVASILRYPATAHPPPAGQTAVTPPTEWRPFAVQDVANIRRSLGGELIDVLANDWSPARRLLRIVEVSQPEHGAATIVYDHSAILFSADTGYAGGDQFTYTVTDEYGNRSTATVTVSIDSTPPPSEITGTTIAGTLASGDGFTTVRGGLRWADFFSVSLKRGEGLCVSPQSGTDLKYHLYLRNSLGELVASGHHPVHPLSYSVAEDGNYILEITSHSPEETTKVYVFSVQRTPCASANQIVVLIDGVRAIRRGSWPEAINLQPMTLAPLAQRKSK
jgi:hypothetical protein